MRLLGLSIIGLGLGGPAAAQSPVRVTTATSASPAQAVKPADLVGQWAKQGEKTPTITIRADSTLVWVGKITTTTQDGQQSKNDLVARWHLAGDTLVTTQAKVRESLKPVDVPGGKTLRTVKLEGRLLTLNRLATTEGPQVFERLDAIKP
jgi:hypothetical protein